MHDEGSHRLKMLFIAQQADEIDTLTNELAVANKRIEELEQEVNAMYPKKE